MQKLWKQEKRRPGAAVQKPEAEVEHVELGSPAAVLLGPSFLTAAPDLLSASLAASRRTGKTKRPCEGRGPPEKESKPLGSGESLESTPATATTQVLP